MAYQNINDVEDKVVEALLKAKGKNAIKEVANKLKINQDLVRHIYNTRKIGQLKQQQELEKIKMTHPVQMPQLPSNITVTSIDVSKMVPQLELIDKADSSNEDANIGKKEGSYFIDDEIKLNLVMEYEAGGITQAELSKKYNISPASVSRIIKELGGGKRVAKRQQSKRSRKSGSVNNHQRRKNIRQLEQEYLAQVEDDKAIKEEIEKVEETAVEEEITDKTFFGDLLDTPVEDPVGNCEKTILSTSFKLERVRESAVRVGLCADRHEMMVEKYIYNTLTAEEMFNYPKLYQQAVTFIKENCERKALHLYCTGIQCALAAVIKAAHDNETALALYHYNASISTYCRQDIWSFGHNDDDSCSIFAELLRKGVVYKFAPKIDLEDFYVISVNRVRDDSDGFAEQAYVICDTMENAFRLYADYVKDINLERNSVRKAVFLTKCKIDEKGKFTWETNLSKSYNFK